MQMESEYQYDNDVNTLFGIEIADSSDCLKSDYMQKYIDATYWKTERSALELKNIEYYDFNNHARVQEFRKTKNIAGFCSKSSCKKDFKLAHIACEYNCAECFAEKMYVLHVSKIGKTKIQINTLGNSTLVPEKISVRFNRGELLIYGNDKELLPISDEYFSFNLINGVPTINIDASLSNENSEEWAAVIPASYRGNMICQSVWEGKTCMENGITNYKESTQQRTGYIFAQRYCYTCAENRRLSTIPNKILEKSKILNITNDVVTKCDGDTCKHAKENIMLKDKIARIAKQLEQLTNI